MPKGTSFAADGTRQPMRGRDDEVRLDRERQGGRLDEIGAGDALDLAAELVPLGKRHVFDHGVADQDVEMAIPGRGCAARRKSGGPVCRTDPCGLRGLAVIRDIEQDEVVRHEIGRHRFPEVARPAEIAHSLVLEIRTMVSQDPAPPAPEVTRHGMNETHPSRHDGPAPGGATRRSTALPPL